MVKKSIVVEGGGCSIAEMVEGDSVELIANGGATLDVDWLRFHAFTGIVMRPLFSNSQKHLLVASTSMSAS